MTVTYKIQVESVDKGLEFLDGMQDRVQKFLDEFPEMEYMQSIERLDNGKYVISIGTTDNKNDDKQILKEFEGLAEAFGTL